MTRITERLAAGATLSYEFFPPRDQQAMLGLDASIDELSATAPAFVSVTCGAGGTTRDRTKQVVLGVTAERTFPAMPHVTCVGSTRAELVALLDDYSLHGVDNILALAGDPPLDGGEPTGDFRHAIELVEMVQEHPHAFAVSVAAHPEVHPLSESRSSDRLRLAEKLALADFAITQFFFDADDYFRLIDELATLGVSAPVVPGVFPVTAPKTVRRFAQANGTAIPEGFFERVEAADQEERIGLAVDAATALCERLLDGGAPGIHLYTMNRAEVASRIVAQLSAFS
jgi:methylenetetrahydrofolate reductase (NADPH)